MLKKILLVLIVILGGFAAFVATRPSSFHVERSATMKAPAAVAFERVDDFHQWAAWSPWDKLDPALKRTYSGPSAGVGAGYAWAGNDKVGEGAMTITAAQPGEKIVLKLEFLKPWKATNTTTFTFKGAGDSTTVTWAMAGESDFMGKAFSVFMDMDKMIGADFEKGLATLKTVAETEAARRAAEAQKAAAEAQKAAAAAAEAQKAAAAAEAQKAVAAAAAAHPARARKK